MKEKKEKPLSPEHELFCQLYTRETAYFGNGTQAYLAAYNLDPNNQKDYNNAKVAASKFLTNSNILARVRELLDLHLNDEIIDKELAFVALQQDDLGAKMRAINEYNKLKQRITEKKEVKHSGEVTISKLLDQLEDGSETQ